jgi:hypothetical protein
MFDRVLILSASAGAGHVRAVFVLAYKIDSLLDNPQRLALMRKNTKRLARPLAAVDIVEKLLSLRNTQID